MAEAKRGGVGWGGGYRFSVGKSILSGQNRAEVDQVGE